MQACITLGKKILMAACPGGADPPAGRISCAIPGCRPQGLATGRGRRHRLTAPLSPRRHAGPDLWGFGLLSVLTTGLGCADLRAAGTDTDELSAA